MKKLLLFTTLVISLRGITVAQQLPAGWWRATLHREDGNTIDFNFENTLQAGKYVWRMRNGAERITINNIEQKQDSIIAHLPLFESQFRLHREKDGSLNGKWIRATAAGEQVMHMTAVPNQQLRFPAHQSKPSNNITGRWAVTFNDNGATEESVGEFKQAGNYLTGTFLTTTGDYRYLEGTVSGDSMLLSTFDGSHAYTFIAQVVNKNTITNGVYISGAKYKEAWTAVKDATAAIPDTASAVYLRKGEDALHFRFPDLDSNLVSINDARFRNKVVVIQIMGSWCPNCMDETAFLSDYYRRNKQRGVEVIGLAYEYSTDFRRSQQGLRKFQKRYTVQYPMLITGVRVSDTARTEKTLPEITPIKMFPTTIFIGRDGKVKKFDTGFNGPGTGAHYEIFKKEFEATINQLLKH